LRNFLLVNIETQQMVGILTTKNGDPEVLVDPGPGNSLGATDGLFQINKDAFIWRAGAHHFTRPCMSFASPRATAARLPSRIPTCVSEAVR
jgi:hypothetical protein